MRALYGPHYNTKRTLAKRGVRSSKESFAHSDRIYRVRSACIIFSSLRPLRREALASSSVNKCTASRGNKVWNYSEDIRVLI